MQKDVQYRPLGKYKLKTMKYHHTSVSTVKMKKIVKTPDAGKLVHTLLVEYKMA